MFQDGDAATDIFLGWHATLGAIDVLDVLRVAILEHAAPTGGRTIHFHLSTDTPSAPGEWLHAPAPADTPFERFRTQLEVHDRYLLIPAALDGGFTPMPNLGIGKHRVCFRRTDDITSSDDPDAGLVMP